MIRKRIVDTNVMIIDGDRGRYYPSQKELLSQGYCVFLNNKNLINDKLSLEIKEYISKEKDLLLKKGKLIRGDIVLSTRGSIGNVGYYSESIDCENIRINSGMVILRNQDNEIDTKYLYHFLKSKYSKQQFNYLSNGSVQSQIPIKLLQNFKINLPDLLTQKKIADLLSSLDDKIEINNQINEQLEELGQALYTKWFVNFDFPNEEGKPYKSSGGEMIESELGMIPKGWIVNEFGNIFDIKYGRGFVKQELKSKGFPVYGASGLIGFTDEYDFESHKFIVGCRGTVGKFNITPMYASVSSNSLIYNFDDTDNFSYFYYLLKNTQFNKITTGSVQKQITIQNAVKLNTIVPNNSIKKQFNDFIYDLLIKREFLKIENKKLEELRDFLIPQLMSGNLEIKDIEEKLDN